MSCPCNAQCSKITVMPRNSWMPVWCGWWSRQHQVWLQFSRRDLTYSIIFIDTFGLLILEPDQLNRMKSSFMSFSSYVEVFFSILCLHEHQRLSMGQCDQKPRTYQCNEQSPEILLQCSSLCILQQSRASFYGSLFTMCSWFEKHSSRRDWKKEAACMKAAGLIGEPEPDESTLGRASWTLGK